MIFSALISSAVAAPAYDAATTGLITYHTVQYRGEKKCVSQRFIQGSTSAVVGTAFSKTNDYNPGVSYTARVVSETNQNYNIEISAWPEVDPNMLLSMYVGDIDANFHPGTWNANVKFVDEFGKKLEKFKHHPDVPTEALFSSVSPVLKKAYEAWPLCQ